MLETALLVLCTLNLIGLELICIIGIIYLALDDIIILKKILNKERR